MIRRLLLLTLVVSLALLTACSALGHGAAPAKKCNPASPPCGTHPKFAEIPQTNGTARCKAAIARVVSANQLLAKAKRAQYTGLEARAAAQSKLASKACA